MPKKVKPNYTETIVVTKLPSGKKMKKIIESKYFIDKEERKETNKLVAIGCLGLIAFYLLLPLVIGYGLFYLMVK